MLAGLQNFFLELLEIRLKTGSSHNRRSSLFLMGPSPQIGD
jgi:hypothetical protein